MEKQFVTYEIALALKELGFNEECFGYYHVNEGYLNGYAFCYSENSRTSDCSILAPLWQQAVDWFREKHNIHLWVYYCMILESNFYQIRQEISKNEYNHFTNENNANKMHKFTYYESREQAILKCIELLKNK